MSDDPDNIRRKEREEKKKDVKKKSWNSELFDSGWIIRQQKNRDMFEIQNNLQKIHGLNNLKEPWNVG